MKKRNIICTILSIIMGFIIYTNFLTIHIDYIDGRYQYSKWPEEIVMLFINLDIVSWFFLLISFLIGFILVFGIYYLFRYVHHRLT